MNDKERKSCVRTIELLMGLAFNVHGVMDVIDAQNCDKIIEMLNKPEPQWIPCSERLPDEDKEVLVTVYFHGLKQTHPTGWNDHIKPSYYVETARQIDGNWSSISDEYKVAKNRHEVIAWMPLPSPYQPEEESE